ncbi:DNA-processing protein DprA [Acidobacteriota bacterium]
MNYPEEYKLKLIAFSLTTCRNQKARRKLIKKGIDSDGISQVSKRELSSLGFLDDEITDIKDNFIKIAEDEVERARTANIELIFKGEEFYPPYLDEIYDVPDYLYATGDKTLLKSKKIAIVGSRRGSSYGWLSLNHIVPDLCEGGLTVVSGMAYGIDSMAHKIALREKGKTIGVNAGGLLHLYPAGNIGLIGKIREAGCIISEFALDVIPRPFYFPIRNRIIAGISESVLIVEAALKSGSLITARLGLEQNKDIFAIPGRIDSPVSTGTNYLIQQGAKPITSPQDILEEYGIRLERKINEEKYKISKKEQKILDLMDTNELKGIDYFAEHIDLSISEIISLLMGLILKNIVVEEAGGYKRIR